MRRREPKNCKLTVMHFLPAVVGLHELDQSANQIGHVLEGPARGQREVVLPQNTVRTVLLVPGLSSVPVDGDVLPTLPSFICILGPYRC